MLDFLFYVPFGYPDVSPNPFRRIPFRRSRFAERTFRRMDVSPNGRFAARTFRRTDVSPNGRFAERTFRRTDVSPKGRFTEWTFRRIHFTERKFWSELS